MPFQTSPGINVSEIDLTNSVAAVSTTIGAIAGVFAWGPINTPTLVDSENTLVRRFGKPSAFNVETFFTAADFLSYSGALYVTRVVSAEARNAGAAALVADETAAEAITDETFIARYPGASGNSLEVSICPDADGFSSEDVSGVTFTTGSNSATVTGLGSLAVGDYIRAGNGIVGYQDLKVTAIVGSTVTFDQKYRLLTTDVAVKRMWGRYKAVSGAPKPGRFHMVVTDVTGALRGTAGAVVEIFENLSINSADKDTDGSSVYYKTVVNTRSQYLFATGADVLTSGPALYTRLTGGNDGDGEGDIEISALALGYDKYKSRDTIDVSLLLAGKARGTTLAEYLISDIAEVRRDCVVFISPPKDAVVNNPGNEVDDILTFRNGLSASSRAFLDSGYKYRYDKYNDKFVYTPLNGDIAGLTARTDMIRDPWFAPAGYNRGQIKNVVRLAFNPTKADRDVLYPADVNAVITEPGEGTLLYGDKTLKGDGSAFSRIGVRRLFIVLEKAIGRSLKATLWEQNDEFTRAMFVNMVTPYLRDIQGRRGLTDFKVVCDGSNNTPEIVDRNEFIADIYLKPTRSINYIQLNLVAVRTGVEFAEIVGKF